MSIKYIIGDCVVFEPADNCIYGIVNGKEEASVKYDIGDNSKDILLELINRGDFISPEDLLQEVWRNKRKIEVDVTSVRQAVSKLRKSLRVVAPELEVIKTVSRRGYILDVHVEQLKETLESERVEHKGRATRYFLSTFFIIISAFSVLLAYYNLNDRPMESPFSEIDGIDEDMFDFKIVQSKYNPIDKSLLPLFIKCSSQLDLLNADTIVIYATTKEFLSLTAFYEKPSKKQITFRLILPIRDEMETYECAL